MNIIELAKEAGFDLSVDEYNGNLEVDCEGVYYTEVLERFAALVRAEREWVDLTDDEMFVIACRVGFDGELMKTNRDNGNPSIAEVFYHAVIAAFKEKNK